MCISANESSAGTLQGAAQAFIDQNSSEPFKEMLTSSYQEIVVFAGQDRIIDTYLKAIHEKSVELADSLVVQGELSKALRLLAGAYQELLLFKQAYNEGRPLREASALFGQKLTNILAVRQEASLALPEQQPALPEAALTESPITTSTQSSLPDNTPLASDSGQLFLPEAPHAESSMSTSTQPILPESAPLSSESEQQPSSPEITGEAGAPSA